MDPAIRLLRELVAVNSVNPTLVRGAPGEAEVATLIAAEMRRIGLDVSIETVTHGRPNVVGVLEARAVAARPVVGSGLVRIPSRPCLGFIADRDSGRRISGTPVHDPA